MRPVLRFTARGPLAVLVLALLGLGLRQLLVETLEPAEAESIVRAARIRDLWAHYQPLVQLENGTYDRAVAEEYAEALRTARREHYANVRVKRTWIPPIAVRQPTYAVTLTRESSGEAEYYRVRGPFARPASRLWWLVPVL
jgi:hypothetical protein